MLVQAVKFGPLISAQQDLSSILGNYGALGASGSVALGAAYWMFKRRKARSSETKLLNPNRTVEL